jgi:hypothetical protein
MEKRRLVVRCFCVDKLYKGVKTSKFLSRLHWHYQESAYLIDRSNSKTESATLGTSRVHKIPEEQNELKKAMELDSLVFRQRLTCFEDLRHILQESPYQNSCLFLAFGGPHLVHRRRNFFEARAVEHPGNPWLKPIDFDELHQEPISSM